MPVPNKNKTPRRYVRVSLPRGILVAWEHSGIRKTSRASEMALGGLFIATPDPPPKGEMIRLVFELAGAEVRARATVRTCRPGKGMGIEFTSMGLHDRARLSRMMKALIGSS